MKKLTFFAVLAAAAMTAALSCSKEGNAPAVAGKTITVKVGAPVVEQDPQTSVVLTGTDPYTVAWEAGDKIRVVNYTNKVAGYNDWGDFTTAAGGATATFTGTAGTYDKASFVVVRAYDGYSWTFTAKSASFKYNIPSTQDGTGIKYCLFGTKDASFDGSTLTIPTMGLKNALSCLEVPAAADVRRIEITVAYTLSTAVGLCSLGDAFDAVGNVLDDKDFAGSGAADQKTITIYNDGALLSGPVYFASRHTLTNATYGDCSLTFVFTNGDGKTATRTVLLFKSGTISKALAGGKLNLLGAVSLSPSDFS